MTKDEWNSRLWTISSILFVCLFSVILIDSHGCYPGLSKAMSTLIIVAIVASVLIINGILLFIEQSILWRLVAAGNCLLAMSVFAPALL